MSLFKKKRQKQADVDLITKGVRDPLLAEVSTWPDCSQTTQMLFLASTEAAVYLGLTLLAQELPSGQTAEWPAGQLEEVLRRARWVILVPLRGFALASTRDPGAAARASSAPMPRGVSLSSLARLRT